MTSASPPPSSVLVADDRIDADADERVALLAEVDFKWLMAGQGWWVDTGRLRADPSYCAGLLGQALQSPCSALRECAAMLQTLPAWSVSPAPAAAAT
jgi:hypothetical protein